MSETFYAKVIIIFGLCKQNNNILFHYGFNLKVRTPRLKGGVLLANAHAGHT